MHISNKTLKKLDYVVQLWLKVGETQYLGTAGLEILKNDVELENLHSQQHQRSSAIIKIQENSQYYVYTTVFRECNNKIGSINFPSIN